MGIADIAKAWNDLIDERGNSNIQRERNAYLKERFEVLQEKVKELETKNIALANENGKLTAQLKAKTSQEEFVEHRGALFKRKPDRTFHDAVYCPSCRKPTGTLDSSLPFSCENQSCLWMSNFVGGEAGSIIKELSKGV